MSEPIIRRPNHAAVELLRRMLKEAEEGEIVAIAIAIERKSGKIGCFDALGDGDRVKVVGAVGLLERKLQEEILAAGTHRQGTLKG